MIKLIIKLDMTSVTPIYLQLRNQIILGIGKGELKENEKLPSVRQLASDIGITTMTVNKTYNLLKQEGFIEIDRREGARVSIAKEEDYTQKISDDLGLLLTQARLKGCEKENLLDMCKKILFQNEITCEINI